MVRISTLRTIERFFLAVLLPAASFEALAQTDVPGSRDHPLFSRKAGYGMEDYEASDFNSRVFLARTTGSDWEERSVEETKTEITYRIKDGAKEPTSLQIVRNYWNAAVQAGGKLVYESNDPGHRVATIILAKGGREFWVEIPGADGGGWHSLAIVERGAHGSGSLCQRPLLRAGEAGPDRAWQSRVARTTSAPPPRTRSYRNSGQGPSLRRSRRKASQPTCRRPRLTARTSPWPTTRMTKGARGIVASNSSGASPGQVLGAVLRIRP